MTPPPRGSRSRSTLWMAALALAAGLALQGCKGGNENENRIKPIMANLNILNPYSGSPDPAVYMKKGSTTGDLVTVDINLRAGAVPLSFNALTLEFTYDFKVVQVGDVFEVNPAVLGGCSAGFACDPLCLNNAFDANRGLTADSSGLAHFLMGVSAKPGCPPAKTGRCKAPPITCTSTADCLHDSCDLSAMKCRAAQTPCTQDADCTLTETCNTSSGECRSTNTPCVNDLDCIVNETCTVVPDTTLVTLAFIAASTIDPPGSPIELFTNPDPSKHGDCEILNGLVDIVPCVDVDAVMTANR